MIEEKAGHRKDIKFPGRIVSYIAVSIFSSLERSGTRVLFKIPSRVFKYLFISGMNINLQSFVGVDLFYPMKRPGAEGKRQGEVT